MILLIKHLQNNLKLLNQDLNYNHNEKINNELKEYIKNKDIKNELYLNVSFNNNLNKLKNYWMIINQMNLKKVLKIVLKNLIIIEKN